MPQAYTIVPRSDESYVCSPPKILLFHTCGQLLVQVQRRCQQSAEKKQTSSSYISDWERNKTLLTDVVTADKVGRQASGTIDIGWK